VFVIKKQIPLKVLFYVLKYVTEILRRRFSWDFKIQILKNP